MPLMNAPASRAPWPPLPQNDSAGRYPEPFPVSQDPKESFWTIAEKAGVDAKDLIRYNFLTNKPEEINWYLKNYVGCVNATADGKNYTFRGATYKPEENKGVIFVPRKAAIKFDPAPIRVIRRKAGAIRWIQLAVSKNQNGEPTYLMPGVDRTAEPIDSKVPGDGGIADRKGQAAAALAQFLATTATGWLADKSVQNRLENLETGFLAGGGGVSDALQPKGKHEAVVVVLRRTRSTVEPGYPKLPFGQPIIAGFGNVKDAQEMIAGFWRRGAIFTNPGKNQEVIFEYYLGTRL